MKKKILLLFLVGLLAGCASTIENAGIPYVSEAYAKKNEDRAKNKELKEQSEALVRQTKIFNEKCEVAFNKFETEIPDIQVKNINDYNDFKGLSLTLDTVLGNATNMTDQNCHPKAYNTSMRSCVVNVSGSECYKKLKSKNDQIKEALRQFREPIYEKEEREFKNKYTGELKGAFNFCVSEYTDCSCPDIGDVFIMHPRTAQVFQNLGNAALLANPYLDYKNIIYISSNIPQPDGVIIDKQFFMQATGLKTYQTPLGANKTVCSYKILNYADFKQKIDGFLFYGK